jgi:hypothetical protein
VTVGRNPAATTGDAPCSLTVSRFTSQPNGPYRGGGFFATLGSMKIHNCTARPGCDCSVRFQLPIALLVCAGESGTTVCLCCGALSSNAEGNANHEDQHAGAAEAGISVVITFPAAA